MSASESSVKSFFSRPEGKTGIVFMVAGAVAALYGLYWALPYLITIVENTIHLAILCGALALMIFVVADPRARALAWYLYKSMMRAITGVIIEIDPIGILKGYVDDLKAKLKEMQKHRSELAGQIQKLRGNIEANEEKRQRSLGMAKQAHERGDEFKKAFVLQSRQAGRLQKSNMTLQSLLNRMLSMAKVLDKMYETSDFLLQDIASEVEVKSAERAAIKASYGAFTAARRIVQGEGDKRELFDQAMEHLANDYAMKVGEIEEFMDMSKGFIQSVDLENGVYEQDALDQFDAWSQKADQLLLESPKQRVASPEVRALPQYSRSPVDAEVEEAATSFDDLFQSKK